MAIDNQPTGTREGMAERRVEALKLRQAGASYREIGRTLGIDAMTAHSDVKAAVAELNEQQNELAIEVRRLELERLDRMQLALWKQAMDGNQGAHDRVLRIMERRAKLLGLDAPTRAELTGKDASPLLPIDQAVEAVHRARSMLDGQKQGGPTS